MDEVNDRNASVWQDMAATNSFVIRERHGQRP